MSTISAQQSPVQASNNQGPSLPLPALPIQQIQQQSPVQGSPVDQIELSQPPATPTKLNATQQTSAPEALSQTTCQPTAPEPTLEPVAEAEAEAEKKPWYAGIVNFFESLVAGFKAIFNAVAPIFQFIAPFLGPIGGFLSGMLGGANSRPSNPEEVTVRPAPSTFAERGTNSVRANAPLGIATGPVIEAPRASIRSS